MRDIRYVLYMYIRFVNQSLPTFDRIVDYEKRLKGKMNFLERYRAKNSVLWLCDQYTKTMRFECEKIDMDVCGWYGPREMSGPANQKTDVHKLVEQFFNSLLNSVTCCTEIYKKKITKEDKDANEILFESIFLEEVKEAMNSIFPYALSIFTDHEFSLTDIDKKEFVKENTKYNVDVTQPSKMIGKSVSVDRKTPRVDKSKTRDKYWLVDNGTVRCLDDNCPEECSMDCPIHVQTLGIEYLVRNDFAQAARLLMKAVEIEPTFADAWNNLAAAYGQMGDHQKAYDAYKKAFDLLKKPNPLYGMAVASKNMKAYQIASQHAKMYVDTFGSDSRISSLMAEISENMLSEKVTLGDNSGHRF